VVACVGGVDAPAGPIAAGARLDPAILAADVREREERCLE